MSIEILNKMPGLFKVLSLIKLFQRLLSEIEEQIRKVRDRQQIL